MNQRYESRAFTSDADFWRTRQLLIDVAALTPPGFSWDTRRWDGMRFHHDDLEEGRRVMSAARLWETAAGELAGVAHTDGPGVAVFQVRPAHRERLAPEMFDWAETYLSTRTGGGARSLEVFAYDHDKHGVELLADRGYSRSPRVTGVLRVVHLAAWKAPPLAAIEGYAIRATSDALGEFEKLAGLLNASFNRTIHTAREYANFVENAPSFRHDLNLVAVTAEGNFAGHTGIAVEPSNGAAVFETVCTHPSHQRMGLASVLFSEGLSRLQSLAMRTAAVNTGGGASQNAFYDSLGFDETYPGHSWTRRF